MTVLIQEPRGLVHEYYSEGKGKTTATMGLGRYASGHGKKALLLRFLKISESEELASIAWVKGVDVLDHEAVRGFVDPMTGEDCAQPALVKRYPSETAVDRVQDESYTLLILGQAIGTMEYGMLLLSRVLDFLCQRPSMLEVVLTGHNPPHELLGTTNYFAEIKRVRRSFQDRIPARIGIER